MRMEPENSLKSSKNFRNRLDESHSSSPSITMSRGRARLSLKNVDMKSFCQRRHGADFCTFSPSSKRRNKRPRYSERALAI